MFKSQTVLFFVLFHLVVALNAQNKIHNIQKGENVYRISLKYKVSMQAIFEANPGSESMIKAGETLIIPENSVSAQDSKTAATGTHLVLRGQTKYGLSKQFGVSIAELEAENPHIKSGLQAGHILKIPEGGQPVPTQPTVPDGPNAHKIVKGETAYSISKTYGLKLQSLLDANPGINIYDLQIGQNLRIPKSNEDSISAKTYTVQAGDTKYGLSKQFQMSVSELEAANPQIVSGLQKGQIISITKSKDKISSVDSERKEDALAASADDYVDYVIQPKETLFSLSQKAGMGISEFVQLNPQLESQVLAGTTIKMPSNAIANSAALEETEPTVSTTETNNTPIAESLLTSTDKTLRKKVAWLLPKSLIELSPLDKIHAEALQQYRGGHIAIEKLKRQGYFIEEVVFDISAKNTNSLNSELSNFDVVLMTKGTGLETQLNLDTQAVMVDLSGTSVKSNTLSLYPLASFEEQVALLFDHIAQKNANLIIINDNKRIQDKILFETYVPKAGLIKVQSNDTFNETELLDLLKSSKLNVVVVNSDKTSVFLNTTNALLKQYAKYDIQLAVLDPSLIPGSAKISDKRFRILNMLFPSMVSLEEKPENTGFTKQYQLDFGSEATLSSGAAYDAIYDSLLRAFHKDGIQKSFSYNSMNSEYLKINYGQLQNQASSNKNIFLYQYNNDDGFEKIK